MLVAAAYPFLNIVGTMIVFFALVMWLRLVFAMFADLFRREDISGWGKAGWMLLAIVLPFLGVLIYLGTNGSGIAQRNLAQITQRNIAEDEAAKARFDRYVSESGGSGGSVAEIAQAKELLDSGALSQAEFEAAKAKALA
jgi:hypothetical protein